MTENKRFTIKEFSTLDAMSSLDVICDKGIELPSSTACDLLNDLYEENTYLKLELDTHKHPLWSTREAERIVNELKEENKQLESALKELKEIGDYQYSRINELSDENEQLKQRNDRQAKQLDRIYQLIEEKDWRTLNDILDDFRKCDEQLQKEWKCYE